MPRIMAFCAHPDDIEFRCAGTLALLKKAGWDVALATVTGGCGGSREMGPEEIKKVRLAEAKAAADIIGAEYFYAGGTDMDVDFTHDLRVKVVHTMRQFRPDVVITLPINDYHTDHIETSKLVRAACFFAPIPNYPEQTLPRIENVPQLYYTSIDKDWHGREEDVDFVVDITSVIDIKENMLAAHASQRNWIRDHHHSDDYIISMKERSAVFGKRIGTEYGEGFCQHLGPGYPTDDPISKTLSQYVTRTRKD